MRVPLSWLKEFIAIELSAEEIAKCLTCIGIEVDSIEKIGLDILSEDTIFDLSLTPNLAHCQSIIGIARELATALDLPFTLPDSYQTATMQRTTNELLNSSLSLSIQDSLRCPHYACASIQDLKVTESPAWLKKRLDLCGLRSINSIVDITNYILLETGHPLHAFDYKAITDQTLIVRVAKENETLLTLDGKLRALSVEDLVICDAIQPLAIAGVMGGLDSEVKTSTTSILIESAYFQPTTVRRTSKRLGLQTEASKRFERGCDPSQVLPALNRAIELMTQVYLTKHSVSFLAHQSRSFEPKLISCRLTRINKILGTQISVEEVKDIFKRLFFLYQWDANDAFHVEIPTYRIDLLSEIDLIEEVARFYGYDRIPLQATFYQNSLLSHAELFLFERKMRYFLLAEGLQEFLTCDLIGPTLLNKVYPLNSASANLEETKIRVLNPNSIEQSILRASLLPSLLQVIKYNSDHQNFDLSGFEIGKVHSKKEAVYSEHTVAAIILTGKQRPAHWAEKPSLVDFYDLKGIVENILISLGVTLDRHKIEFKNTSLSALHSAFHPGRRASIFIDDIEMGSMGQLHPTIQHTFDLSSPVFFAELNLHSLYNLQAGREKKMQDLPIFPGSPRDWTLTLDEELPVAPILDFMHSLNSHLLERIEIADLFRGAQLGQHKKNVTFHLMYRDKNKTCEQSTIDREHERVMQEVKQYLSKLMV